MTPKTSPFFLCKARTKPDARCRKLPRCKACSKVLHFNWHTGLCFECEQRAKAEAQAKADQSTRLCQHCGEILRGVFADRICTACAGVHNVTGGAA